MTQYHVFGKAGTERVCQSLTTAVFRRHHPEILSPAQMSEVLEYLMFLKEK